MRSSASSDDSSVWFIQPLTACWAIQEAFSLLTTLHTLIENMLLHTPSHPPTHAPAHARAVYGPEISDIQVLPLLLVNSWTFGDDGSWAIGGSGVVCVPAAGTVRHTQPRNHEFHESNLNHLRKKKSKQNPYYCLEAPCCRLPWLSRKVVSELPTLNQSVSMYAKDLC